MSCWARAFVSSWRTASRIASNSTSSAETSPSSFSVASLAASSSSEARTGKTSITSSSSTTRTREPRNGSDSTRRRSCRSRRASRTGAWLVQSSCAILVSTSRSPGWSSPLAIRCSRTSLTCSRRTVREIVAISWLTSAGDHRIGDLAHAVDLDRDGVARLQQPLRVAEYADAGGRARQDQVAGLERRGSRGVADDLIDAEDEVRGRRVLQRLARDDRPDRERVRVGHLGARDERADGAERVGRLAARPLAVGELEVASRDVICDEVAAHGFERVLLGDVLDRLADHDAELGLVVALLDHGRDHDRIAGADQRGRVLREEEGSFGEIDSLLLGVVSVVEAD